MRKTTQILLGIVVGWCALSAAPALAEPHPRLALYGGVHNANFPLTVGNESGPLNDAALDAEARYHDLILQPSNITPYRPDILAALRQRRPDIQLYAYILGHYIWQVSHADSFVHYPTRFRRMVRDLNGFLYNQAGAEFSGANVNLAKRDALGRFVVAEGVADLFYDALFQSGQWDGLFIDQFCNSILWMESASERIDYARAGYASLNAFDLAWKAASDTVADRLRRRVGNDYVLVGNCAAGTKYASFNGWMREDFPFQGGGTWYENMYRDPGGYFIDEERFRTPRHNYIFTAVSGPTTPYSATNLRKLRFGLGSASLGNGYAVFAPRDLDGLTHPYYDWWYDEYAVNLSTGRSTVDPSDTGWLGEATGPAFQMIWPGTGPDAVTNPGFETNVTDGWGLTVFGASATVVRDAASAAVGSASARVNVASAGTVDHAVVFRTTGRINMTAGQAYSATFWAKASTTRTIGVAAGIPGSGSLAGRALEIGTSWKQYQVVLSPSSSGPAELHLQLGKTAGNVWVDDCHMQAGVFNIYRRDFQNGIVLVNPAGTAQAVPLERAFRRILGTVDPIGNNGQTVTQVTVPPSDALFLLGDDLTPPAAVIDLTPISP
jgi:hypothetical protein